jgi:hypothetical protein
VPNVLAAIKFGDNYYQVIASPLDWTSAKIAAAQLVYNGMQGHLATVSTKAENDLIATLRGAGRNVWIDGSDAGIEGIWGYTSGPQINTPLSYTNWDSSTAEPNGGTNENCLLQQDDGTWGSAGCTKGFHFVVEYEKTCALPWCNGSLLAMS